VRLNHRANVVSGVFGDRCADILSRYFAEKRRQGKR
jgi:tRNA(adenine34) deaminase